MQLRMNSVVFLSGKGAGMKQVRRNAAICSVLAMGVIWATGAFAASTTRTSSFAYDSASGLLTQEVVEPNQSTYRLETDYLLDAYGNKTQVTVSGIDIATRSSSAAYDAQGRFVVSATNALNRSESWQYDPRFGKPTSHTGPNGLTTTWSYDGFGRKILEVRPDGTQTAWAYLLDDGAYRIQATPLAADGVTQIGPQGTVYFDNLDREVKRETQGFDGSTIAASTQYDSIGRVQLKSRPYFSATDTQWAAYTYDALGRVLTETMPDSSVTQHAYHGLVTTDTNALNQTRTVTKNSQGKVVSVTDAANNTTSYSYDPFGNLTKTTDAVGNVVTASYDTRGRKISANDPNMGAWSYGYDTLDELVSQVDAKSQAAALSYDKLGRLTQRVEPDMTAAWIYDTAAHGIGKLSSESITAGADAGFQRTYSYDTLGRPSTVATTIGTTTYTIGGTYDANGRLSSVTYPSGFAVNYLYTSLGYAQQLTNSTTGQVYWTANARDAELHLLQDTAGNGVVSNRTFSATTGRMGSITAGLNGSSAVQNMSYTYAALGNLLTRADSNTGLSESLVYDVLNRLTQSTVGVSLTKAFSYDPIGNLLSKSDAGTYTYPAPGQPQPNAVLSISGSTISTTFTYDPNGNQTAGLGRIITYTSYNKPATITQGTRTISFGHDPEHQRFKQVTPEGTTFYFSAFGIYVECQSGANRWNEYLIVGGSTIGMRFLYSDESVYTRYFHYDHLGSVSVVTDENGNVLERDSYDAWGKRRYPDGTDDPSGSITSLTTRGFTDQEMLAVFNLVHLNGRVYDPLVGRMMSADPTVPDPLNGQAWNRYSYVGNNPLAFTDPTGYSWLSEAFNWIAGVFKRSLVQIAVSTVCAITPGCLPFLPLVAAVTSAVVAGVTTGKLSAALEAGLISGVTAFAFNAIGGVYNGVGQPEGSSAFAQADTLEGGDTPIALPEVRVTAPAYVPRVIGARSLGGGLVNGLGSGLTGSVVWPIAYQGTFHDYVRNELAASLRIQGWNVGVEIPVSMVYNNVLYRTRVDIMVTVPNTPGYRVIEVKTGMDPPLTEPQKYILPGIPNGYPVNVYGGYDGNHAITALGFQDGQLLPQPGSVTIFYQQDALSQFQVTRLDALAFGQPQYKIPLTWRAPGGIRWW
jgi:RHS repeat-associated protein